MPLYKNSEIRVKNGCQRGGTSVLILAKRGTLFKTLKQGPAAPINVSVQKKVQVNHIEKKEGASCSWLGN